MQKKRLLLVDDNDMILKLYRYEFEEEGYDVEVSHNGGEAIEQFRNNPPDLVILDINMPGMNGIEVLRQMKEVSPELPIILCSAYQEYKQDFSTWASDAYVVKSSDLDELKNTVRQHLL